MGTMTVRLPDDKHARLKALAKSRHISVNQLFEELATIALTEFDAKTHFVTLAAQGDAKRGLALLDKLDRLEKASQ